MRILGLDLGTQTLGMALSDENEIIATGLENFTFKPFDYEAAYRKVDEIIKRYGVKMMVIGMPYHLHGENGKSTERVNKFKAGLEDRFHLPVETYDERWSTKVAASFLIEADLSRGKRKKVIDKMSAVVILQGYLDRKGAKKNG